MPASGRTAVTFKPEDFAKRCRGCPTSEIDSKSSGTVSTFITRVREVFTRISGNPQMHGKVYQDVRKAVVQQFPYVVLYQEEPSEVLVIAVFHTARDPAVWQGRV